MDHHNISILTEQKEQRTLFCARVTFPEGFESLNMAMKVQGAKRCMFFSFGTYSCKAAVEKVAVVEHINTCLEQMIIVSQSFVCHRYLPDVMSFFSLPDIHKLQIATDYTSG